VRRDAKEQISLDLALLSVGGTASKSAASQQCGFSWHGELTMRKSLCEKEQKLMNCYR